MRSPRQDIRYWVLHSAGRRVLRRYGNMSPATILFVLEETLRHATPVPGE